MIIVTGSSGFIGSNVCKHLTSIGYEILYVDDYSIIKRYHKKVGLASDKTKFPEIESLFKALEPELLDRQVIKKKRTKWDDANDPIEYEFEDVYELYSIDGVKLFEKDRWGNLPNNVYAVRCWCTTTNREYWLYVPREAALGNRWWDTDESQRTKPDAIRAIAWTIRLDVQDPERIYRQGDIIVAKIGKNTTENSFFRHLEKDQYLQLMYSET